MIFNLHGYRVIDAVICHAAQQQRPESITAESSARPESIDQAGHHSQLRIAAKLDTISEWAAQVSRVKG